MNGDKAILLSLGPEFGCSGNRKDKEGERKSRRCSEPCPVYKLMRKEAELPQHRAVMTHSTTETTEVAQHYCTDFIDICMPQPREHRLGQHCRLLKSCVYKVYFSKY